MIKKRIVSGLLVLVLLLSALPPALAAEGPKISLSSGSVDPGGSVTLTVSVADNPGMATCMLYFYYDTTLYRFKSGLFHQRDAYARDCHW